MKSAVVYFSQTGNTKKVAEAIGGGIALVTGQCDLVRIQDATVSNLASYDLLGLGSPIFVLRPPVNVSIFISRLRPLKGKPCFIFATHGGHPGNFMPIMAQGLARQGLLVMGNFDCDADVTRAFYPYPFWTTGHPDEADLEAAAAFGREMAERGSHGQSIPLPAFPRVSGALYDFHPRAWDANQVKNREFMVPMSLDMRRCQYPRCRLCVEHCPMNAIDLSATPVVFRRGCISCLLCEKLCPTGAIEIDEAARQSIWKNSVARFKEYRYPEFFLRAQRELIENRGSLYRPLAEVDLDDPERTYNKVRRSRPRFVIC